MILGRSIFKHETTNSKATSIVPLAFPIIAGAGTMTTIISLKAAYQVENIIIGIMLNLLVVYVVLRNSQQIEKILGPTGSDILRKVFGMILIAISIKLIKTNLF
jgi:multiple antibiotic resistance protein